MLADLPTIASGRPGAYGVVTMPFSVREGINVFLAGFIPTENLRFRNDELTFKVGLIVIGPPIRPEPLAGHRTQVKEAQEAEIDAKAHMNYKYPAMTKTQGDFKLAIEAGEFTDSQIVVMLGQNGAYLTPCLLVFSAPVGLTMHLSMLQVPARPRSSACSPVFRCGLLASAAAIVSEC